MDETLITFGGEVKALGQGRVGGYLARFTTDKDPDLTGDFFTKDTDFFLDDEGTSNVPVIYDHGLNATLKNRKLGRGTVRIDDVGLWVEAELRLRDEYEKAVYAMAKAGKLGWSSGAVSHLVEKERSGKAFHVKSWVPGEASLTPIPCEPRCTAVALKSYAAESAHDEIDAYFEGEESTPKQTLQEHSETVVTAVEERANEVGALADEVKAFTARVRNKLEFRTNDPIKAGRTISKPNRERLAATRGRLAELRETLGGIEADLDELLALAEPKGRDESAFEVEMPGLPKSLAPPEEVRAAVAQFESLALKLSGDSTDDLPVEVARA